MFGNLACFHDGVNGKMTVLSNKASSFASFCLPGGVLFPQISKVVSKDTERELEERTKKVSPALQLLNPNKHPALNKRISRCIYFITGYLSAYFSRERPAFARACAANIASYGSSRFVYRLQGDRRWHVLLMLVSTRGNIPGRGCRWSRFIENSIVSSGSR